MIRLLLKKYSDGTYYLCKRESEDYNTYKGSGKNVKNRSVDLVGTVVLGVFENKETFKKSALYYSDFYDVVRNPLFRNLKAEEGDGGDTLSGRKVYNDGKRNKFFSDGDIIPKGWVKGRFDKHNFSSESQRQRGANADHTTEKQKAASRRMGLGNNGRTHPKVGCLNCHSTFGINNAPKHFRKCYDNFS